METENVRAVGHLKLTDTSKTHISELIRRETAVGPGGKIPFLIDTRSVLLYDPRLTVEELVASIEALKGHAILRRRIPEEVLMVENPGEGSS